MGKGTEDLHKLHEKFDVENKGENNPHPSTVAGKPPRHEGGEAQLTQSSIFGCFGCNVEPCGKGLGQVGHRGGGSVVPSQNTNEPGP